MVLRVIAVRVLGSENSTRCRPSSSGGAGPGGHPTLKQIVIQIAGIPASPPPRALHALSLPRLPQKSSHVPDWIYGLVCCFSIFRKIYRQLLNLRGTEERFPGQVGDFPALPSSRGLRRKSADVGATGTRPNKNRWTARTVLGPIEPNEHYRRGAQRLVSH
jgi:hypothetical protein